ncbi:MAG: gamma-glutamyltransferase [Candidatus Bathyarchaeota archaeon]|nr:gamma-glutamyltransferase [Candidatus Bathyarchaeota archaeon]
MSERVEHPIARVSSDRYLETHKKEVVASRGVVVANHPLASSAGVEMLAHGGNAFDAAVASLFALTVVEPMMVSMFGAGFFVFRDAETGRIETLDNYAVSPKAATDDMYTTVERREPGQYLFETVGRENMVGRLSVATPGTLKGWERMIQEHGTFSLSEVMAPAIRLARRGYRASQYLAQVVKMAKADIERFPETAETFLPGGKPLEQGRHVVMPDYAETLENVAKGGSDALYRGELGRAVIDDMEENGGILTMEDLKNYEVITREPVWGTYRDRYEVYSMAPGSSGGVHIIQMLNLLERFDVPSLSFGSVEYVHLFAEVLKIAFADRQEFLGDPSKVEVPIEGIVSKEYAKERVGEIGEVAGVYSPGDPATYAGDSSDTTHVSAMDSDGNMVAATQTLFSAFGSKVTVPGTGMLLNNCMGLFDPRPGRANSVAGGKRMLSSMAPTIVTRDGSPYMCIGTPGGTRIFPSVCQALVNVIDFGMTIQQAVEAPRVWTMGIPGTPEERLYIEPEFPEEVLEGLRSRGHEVFVVPKIAGGMNGVLVDPSTGLMHCGACWRADGTPMGVSGGWAHPKGFVEAPAF